MGEMKAIQTEYKGYLFRSRLEARWAVFFDACGVDWEYEPEGYDLGNGIHYLPDFLLKRVQLGGYGSGSEFSEIRSLYVEVKGQMTQADSEKILAFYKAGLADGLPAISDTPVLVLGDIPPGTTLDRMRSWVDAESGRPFPWGARAFHSGTVDGMDCTAFPCVNREGYLELFGQAEEYNRRFIDRRATERAYRLARQARFEHGETPKVRRARYA
ncbi:hypothetical protein C819_03983 [Lachnospiraceae bacterium 10-1]|jgi:hypothetical protein|nr:hypothetical protein [uncultured Acetatifactor sp.]EOS73258.1 hypothetical protein C819_03983 [Lachnospiraceae bacterium 10-1]GFI31327.1 hypothetical protein IMSAGC013_02721 [Lachnospiraceae bacterium]